MENELLQKQVEWVLETEGPLSTMHLVKIINAFPSNSSVVYGVSRLEVFIRSTLNQLREGGQIYFDARDLCWHKAKNQNLTPVISVEQLTKLNEHPKIGDGSEVVYCLYKSMARYRAAVSGEQRWPLKVGKTIRSINNRLSELSTSSEEVFVIGLEIATNESLALEAALHEKLRYCRIDTQGAGTEWFWSDLEEVLNHYQATQRNEAI